MATEFFSTANFQFSISIFSILSEVKTCCRKFDNLISCMGGECLNVTMIYKCNYVDTLESLKEPTGNPGYVTDGYCNCNQCTETNTSVVADDKTGELYCPKAQLRFERHPIVHNLFLNMWCAQNHSRQSYKLLSV